MLYQDHLGAPEPEAWMGKQETVSRTNMIYPDMSRLMIEGVLLKANQERCCNNICFTKRNETKI